MLKVCRLCGRISYLHDTCPDCGRRMKKALPSQTFFYVLLNLPPALVVVLIQLWLFRVIHPFSVPIKIFVIGLCIMLHGLMLFLLWSLWRSNRLHISRVPPQDVAHFQCRGSRNSIRDLVRFWRIFDLARDAYYLDVSWLEQQSMLPEADCPEQCYLLLGRSIWLSVICDTPRLALTRLRLLGKGKIFDGCHTDLDEIMNQLLPTTGHVEQLLWEQPQMLQTLCLCVMFDAVGISPENRRSICTAALRLMRDRTWSEKLTGPEWMQLLQMLKFCEPESLADLSSSD